MIEIVKKVAALNTTMLKKVNNKLEGSVLWFPRTLENIIAKSEVDYSYHDGDSGIYINTLNKTNICNNITEYHETCFVGSKVSDKGSEDITHCIKIPLKTSLCNDRTKKGLISITPAKFYIVGNSTLESEDDVDFNTSTENDNSILTIENLEDCNSQPVLNSEHITGVAGVNGDANIESFPVKIVAHYKKVCF